MTEPIGAQFMRLTQYKHMEPTAENRGEQQPPLELEYDPAASLIPLPEPDEISVPDYSLRQAIESRRTGRRYAEAALTLDELSYLLWATQGVREVTKRPITLRTVPSAGGRHALETYLLVNRVAEIEPGIYRYVALGHALLPLRLDLQKREEIAHACLDQKQILTSAVTFIWVAVTERMVYRYGQRGYRYLHLDAGHVCQNLYLAGEQIGCRSCAIAAFDDDLLNTALDLDGTSQFAIYLGSLGKKP